jgi:hypothetical protein
MIAAVFEIAALLAFCAAIAVWADFIGGIVS